jgi:hypothetical protein
MQAFPEEHEFMTTTHLSAVVIATSLGTVSLSANAASSPTTSVPAYWAQHDEIDELGDLPHPYRCDDLYYKYRDVLLRLGAQPGMKIYAYGCSRAGQPASGTPRVDLTYAVPREMPVTGSGGVGLKAARATVKLAPGQPKSLTPDDCILLNDMRQTVLASFANSMNASSLHCNAARTSKHFALVVQTLLPVETGLSPPAS